MSEELLQRDLIKNPDKIGTWNFYNIGSTTVKTLKSANIIRNIDYGKDIDQKKIDALITKEKDIIAIIEYKSPRNFNTEYKKNKAINQEINVAKQLNTKLMIATDTKETLWINVLTGNTIKDENGKDFKYLFDYKDTKLFDVINNIIHSINSNNDRILPKKLIDPTDLSKQIWQDVWSVSGATPENCLYTFVELFIFKYLSDLNILKGDFNFYELLKKYSKNEENYVLQHYADIIRPKIKELFPAGIDKTTIINGTIFVSKEQKAIDGYGTVFRKVLEKFNNYGKLEYIDYDFKSKLFESFLKESISKKNWGQYFTPIKVVRAINEMAYSELREGIVICDPACGVGKFPLEFIKENIRKFFFIKDNKIECKIKIVGFDKGFDKDEQKTIILAKANMLIYFCDIIKENPEYTKEFANLFNETFTLKTNSILGTLSEPIENMYDLILTNPPYVTSGSSNLKEEILKDINLKNYFKINSLGVEGLFMEWIVRALKPSGKAFVILPDGIFNRKYDKNLRKFILDNCYIDAIISLPIKTFFTTPKKTYILAITKKNNLSDTQISPVFTYLCSEIGESRDINRFDIEQDDLKKAVKLFNLFKGNKEYFSEINLDNRCKIQDISRFIDNIETQWIIEKDWTETEKAELGIIEKNKPISIFDFSNTINMIVDNVKEHQQLIDMYSLTETCEMTEKYIGGETGLFFVEKGNSKYTKKYMNKNKGVFPVYSSKTTDEGIIDYINTYDYDCECLTWTTDGTYVGTVFIRNGKFSMTTHCGALFLKDEFKNKISIKYLYAILNNILPLHKVGEGSNKRLGKDVIKKIKIKIPIDNNGNYDLIKQEEIAEKYLKIEEIKKNIISELNIINNISVDIGLK